MANVESMYEEKLSPKLNDSSYERIESGSENEELNYCAKVDEGGNDVKSFHDAMQDAVLDEIAAKVNAIDLQKDDDDNIDHAKCIETVRGQGEYINTLVEQLHIMIDEYGKADSEREYYEALSEALLRCIEITDDRQLTTHDDSCDDEEGIENVRGERENGQGQRIIITQLDDDDACTSTDNIDIENSCEEGVVTSPGSAMGESKEADGITSEKYEIEKPRKVKSSEMKRINRVLLREIFELRDRVEKMKEYFGEYVNAVDSTQSDNDTDDDDVSSIVERGTPGKYVTKDQDYDTQKEESLKNPRQDISPSFYKL